MLLPLRLPSAMLLSSLFAIYLCPQLTAGKVQITWWASPFSWAPQTLSTCVICGIFFPFPFLDHVMVLGCLIVILVFHFNAPWAKFIALSGRILRSPGIIGCQYFLWVPFVPSLPCVFLAKYSLSCPYRTYTSSPQRDLGRAPRDSGARSKRDAARKLGAQDEQTPEEAAACL